MACVSLRDNGYLYSRDAKPLLLHSLTVHHYEPDLTDFDKEYETSFKFKAYFQEGESFRPGDQLFFIMPFNGALKLYGCRITHLVFESNVKSLSQWNFTCQAVGDVHQISSKLPLKEIISHEINSFYDRTNKLIYSDWLEDEGDLEYAEQLRNEVRKTTQGL